jgi:hypothetical protein
MSTAKTPVEADSVRQSAARVWSEEQKPVEPSAEQIDAHEIVRSSWSAFCQWLTTNLAGVSTTIVRDEGADRRMVECLERRLDQIESVQLADRVTAIKISINLNGSEHLFEVAGPSWMRVHYNAAGFIRLLEIGYDEGKLVLRFTGVPSPGPVFTANSWGE